MGYPIYHSQYTAAQIEASIGKTPRIKISTRTWEIWDIATSQYVDTGVSIDTQLFVDPTLTESGYAADAKVTGDKIGELKSALGNLDISANYKTLEEGIIKRDGSIDSSQTTWLHSALIPVISSDLYGEFRAVGVSSGYYNVWAYDEDGEPIGGVYANTDPTFDAKVNMTLPSGTKYFRFMISKNAYTNNPNFFFSQSVHNVEAELSKRINAIDGQLQIEEYTSVSMFNTMGVIGDSFSSGAIKDGDNAVNCYPISWPQILGRKMGINVTNYSSTGSDVSRFLYDAHPSYSTWNIAKLENDAARDVYIIVLGINDEKSTADHSTYVDVGTTADIDMSDYTQNADTFCGHYGEMLSRIIAHAPTSPIICVVPWNRKGTAKGNAIIAIAEMFGLPYFCMDDSDYYATDFWRDSRELSHPIGVTYAGMANVFEQQIQACMIDHISYFANYRPQ